MGGLLQRIPREQHKMTKQEAKKILEAYRETDEDTGEKYGYIIQSYHRTCTGGFVFRCKIEGVPYSNTDNLPLIAVLSDGKVVVLPT